MEESPVMDPLSKDGEERRSFFQTEVKTKGTPNHQSNKGKEVMEQKVGGGSSSLVLSREDMVFSSTTSGMKGRMKSGAHRLSTPFIFHLPDLVSNLGQGKVLLGSSSLSTMEGITQINPIGEEALVQKMLNMNGLKVSSVVKRWEEHQGMTEELEEGKDGTMKLKRVAIMGKEGGEGKYIFLCNLTDG